MFFIICKCRGRAWVGQTVMISDPVIGNNAQALHAVDGSSETSFIHRIFFKR